MSYKFLDLGEVNAPYAVEIKECLARVVDSGRYIGGEEVSGFEARLAALHGLPYDTVIGVSNGLDALRLILRGYIELGRLRPGDGVIVPANTYVASVLAITDNGLRPVFVDPDPVTHNLDTAKAIEACGPEVKAVMPVHLYGRVCWSPRSADMARDKGLLVIEDNAQAIGAVALCDGLFGSRMSGTLGDAAAFSFYPTKNIGAMGDAGVVMTRDKELAATVRALRNYGSHRQYENLYAGLNCRLDPMQAAVLSVKLPHLAEENALRAANAAIYDATIGNPAVIKPLYSDQGDCVWHQYVVRVADRDAFRRYMADNGVETAVHYPVPPHRQPCYEAYSSVPLPVADRLAAEVVSLPVSRCTSADDASAIARIINRYVGKPLVFQE